MSDQVRIFQLIVGYHVAVLLVGLLFSYMGYRLFLADKVAPAGDFSAQGSRYTLSLRGGAPGVFFCFFGAILICISIYKGLTYESQMPVSGPVAQTIPDELPPH